MKAWRVYGANDMRLEEVPVPEAPPGWVVIAVKAVQASITEVVRFRGGSSIGSSSLDDFIRRRGPSQIFGHEFSGEVTQVGRGVARFQVGDRVAATGGRAPCGQCAMCRSGREDLCPRGPLVGGNVPGCFAEYAAIPIQDLVKLPSGVSFSEGACFQPLIAALGSVHSARLEPGESVAVFGQGVMGLGVMQLARNMGAGRVFVTDIRAKNREMSLRLGADVALNPQDKDPVAEILGQTDGLGADLCFDCAGGDPTEGLSGFATLHQALQSVRVGGRVVQTAIINGKLDLEAGDLRRKSIQYIYPEEAPRPLWDFAVHLVATGRVQLKTTISYSVPSLEQVPQIFAATANKEKYNIINPAQVVVA